MAKLLKLRRGTTTQHGSFTGAEGEVTVDTDKDSLVVHNGSTAGGFPIARSPATAGTVGVSEVVQVDANKDASGFRNITVTGDITAAGELDAATLDISGDADIDGTLEADAITVDGTALNEYISDTVGAMVGSNTETGIAVTYEDSDNTLDFSITSIPGVTFTGDVIFDNATNDDKDLTWDMSDDALEFKDNVKAVFGDDGDLTIRHDGSNSYIDEAGDGDLLLTTTAGSIQLKKNTGDKMLQANVGGSVDLYHNNVKKLEITASGINVTGGWTASTDSYLGDGCSLVLGAGNDGLLFSDGNNGFYRTGATAGTFTIQSGAATPETIAVFTGDAGTELYHDNVKTFNTIANGINVQGTEGAEAYVEIFADEGDDDQDKWRVLASAANNTLQFQNYGSGSWADEGVIGGDGSFTATGNVTAYSDARLKTDVETIENALDKVTKLRGVSYTKVDTQERGIGVIAQEIEEVIPEVVQDGAYKSVAYGNIVGVLIEAIKELKSEIDELKGGK